MRFIRTRFVPADSTLIARELGAVYTYMSRNRFAAIAYAGKSTKASWHYIYRDVHQREAKITEFFAGLEAHAKAVADRRAQAKQPHSLKVGAIVYNSWGYEQTNVDFYQVVRVSSNYVWLQTINARTVESTGDMSSMVEPVPDTISGEVTKHRATLSAHGAHVNFRHGCGSLYDGTPKYCSWYA